MLLRRVALVVAVLMATKPCIAAANAHCWWPPVSAVVVDGFREPACRWCPGNRGLEYATAAGERVAAVASGTVVFSGAVAGTRYVVVELADGLRVTYGNLYGPLPEQGAVVISGAVIGLAAGHVHLGVRDGERYVDPAPMIGEPHGVRRLVPIDGTPPLPPPPAELRCA